MSEEYRVRIIEDYVNRYTRGVCMAIANIWGEEKMKAEFGGTTPEEALRNCINVARNNAREYITKWLEVWPARMAKKFKEE